MRFKFKTLAVALTLSVAATSANAAITGGSSSELVFSAWDPVAGVGYTYDLNWTKALNDFVGVDLTPSVSNNNTLQTNAKVQSSMIGVGGVIYDQVLTGFSSATPSNVQWNLGGYDTTGRKRLLITQGDSLATFASTDDQVSAAATLFSAYAPASNAFIVTAADDTFANTLSTNGAAYAGNTGIGFNGNTVDTTNILGGSSNLYFLAQTTQLASAAQAINMQLFSHDGNAIVARTYFQDDAWRLNISSVAAVPEAETNAMMLAGLGLMGFIVRRRRNALSK